jgi:hypothetical protein
MRYATMRRAFAVCASLLACGLAACGGGGDAEDTAADAAPAPSKALVDTLSPTGVRLRVQLTGLILMVPRKPDGRPTEVLLPVPVDSHIAVIGFIHENDSALCTYKYQGGICYASLAEWSLAAIGTGGEPDDNEVRLPRGLVNVTRGSGGHTAKFPDVDERIRSRITLLAGQVRDEPCSLGSWSYGPANGPSEILPLVNMLTWDIQYPTRNSVELVFHHRASAHSAKRVTLLPDAGDVNILIAHIPVSDAGQLPPNRPTTLPSAPTTNDTPAHFHHYYDVIAADYSKRPLPRFVSPQNQRPCSATIKATFDKGNVQGLVSLGTYSCVMASGTEGP